MIQAGAEWRSRNSSAKPPRHGDLLLRPRVHSVPLGLGAELNLAKSDGLGGAQIDIAVEQHLLCKSAVRIDAHESPQMEGRRETFGARLTLLPVCLEQRRRLTRARVCASIRQADGDIGPLELRLDKACRLFG